MIVEQVYLIAHNRIAIVIVVLNDLLYETDRRSGECCHTPLELFIQLILDFLLS